MFKDKAMIVTGSASGIGAAAARRLAQEGASVLLADIDHARVEAVAAQIREAGGQAIAMRCDVSSLEENEAIAAACIDAFGGIDGVFLNAGLLVPYQPFGEIDLDRFDRVIGVNLRGPLYGLKVAYRHLRPGGAAVVTASAAGVMGLAIGTIYSASKHGAVGVVRSAAPAFAERGLRVNAICPGGVNTPMVGKADETKIVPPGDLPFPVDSRLDPQHVAEIALFLLSRPSSAINGQAIVADVGVSAALGTR